MRSKGEILGEITRISVEKSKLDIKIGKLETMLIKLEIYKCEIDDKKDSYDLLEPVYQNMISANDSSFGSLVDYYVETAQNEKLEYNQVKQYMSDFAENFISEYGTAEEILGEWNTLTKEYQNQIDALWEEYNAAI